MLSKTLLAKKKIYFITGNANKFREAKTMFENTDYELVQHNIDLPEFQGESEEIAYQKALTAKSLVDKEYYPFIIEDSGLHYNCLGGMPGPYIRSFLKAMGCDGLYKLILGFDDNTAYAQCIVSLMVNENSEPMLFKGKINGKIVRARGETTFGWDPIFEPDGMKETFAEIDKEIKNKISHRANAFCSLLQYLE